MVPESLREGERESLTFLGGSEKRVTPFPDGSPEVRGSIAQSGFPLPRGIPCPRLVSAEKEEQAGIEQTLRTVLAVLSMETDETLIERETGEGEEQGERAASGGGRDGDRGGDIRGEQGETGEVGNAIGISGEHVFFRVRRQRDHVIPAFRFFFSHKEGSGSNDPVEVRLDAVPQG